tara:strand:+ start:561 stop:1520 length:960 start_codon:yes stop_codon:yes gene_type:complete
MAFQNNSGDIILDVVLTDEGRRRLALGDGSFQVTQFALGDDEINYALFQTGSTTALQDLSILQTPILEAFTNNASMMKTKLLSLPNPNLLYLPVLKLNEGVNSGDNQTSDQGNFIVCVDKATWDDGSTGNNKAIGNVTGQTKGMIYGLATDDLGAHIIVDSGIDSTNVSQIDRSLIETSFMIEIDNRLGSIISSDGKQLAGVSRIDDDNIAAYILDLNTSVDGGSSFVSNVNQTDFGDTDSPLNGPVGARLKFKIRSSQDLRVSNFLFDRIGSQDTTTYNNKAGSSPRPTVKIIDSIVRVSGLTTGYSIDIPVRFAKSI